MAECTSKPIDLGGGITEAEIRFIDGVPGGLYYEHQCVRAKPTPGYIPFGPPQGWTLEKLEPLTLSPSLLCRQCGHHGFIRDGRWVPA